MNINKSLNNSFNNSFNRNSFKRNSYTLKKSKKSNDTHHINEKKVIQNYRNKFKTILMEYLENIWDNDDNVFFDKKKLTENQLSTMKKAIFKCINQMIENEIRKDVTLIEENRNKLQCLGLASFILSVKVFGEYDHSNIKISQLISEKGNITDGACDIKIVNEYERKLFENSNFIPCRKLQIKYGHLPEKFDDKMRRLAFKYQKYWIINETRDALLIEKLNIKLPLKNNNNEYDLDFLIMDTIETLYKNHDWELIKNDKRFEWINNKEKKILKHPPKIHFNIIKK
jgi:hypothetical protein